MRECGVAQAYERGELCSGKRRAWSRGFIRTLSLFFFSGVAWPAPSNPVLTYSNESTRPAKEELVQVNKETGDVTVKPLDAIWLSVWLEAEGAKDAMLPGQRETHELERPSAELALAIQRAPSFDAHDKPANSGLLAVRE